jgi:hypothetical protein
MRHRPRAPAAIIDDLGGRMREMSAEARSEGNPDARPARVNPADPFMVRGGGAPSTPWVQVSPEQWRALRRLRDAGRWMSMRELPRDMLASLLRRRMVSLYGDRVELTSLGALALATPMGGSARNQR